MVTTKAVGGGLWEITCLWCLLPSY